MANKNKGNAIDTLIRYGKAAAKGLLPFHSPIFEVGKEFASDIRDYKEEQDTDPRLEEIKAEIEDEQYENALEIAESVIEDNLDNEEVRVASWLRINAAMLLYFKMIEDDQNDDTSEFMHQINSYIMDYGNEYGWDDNVNYQQMVLFQNSAGSDLIELRNLAIVLMGSDNKDYAKYARQIYCENTQELFEKFNRYETSPSDDDIADLMKERGISEGEAQALYNQTKKKLKFTNWIEYDERKYIYIGKDIYHIGGTYQFYEKKRIINWIFTIDELPHSIEFPMGRPQPGLYVAHPVKTHQYYPIETAEEQIFMDKVQDFCMLVQGLGATEVTFSSNKGISVSQGMKDSFNVNANVGVKGVNIGGSYGQTGSYDQDYTMGQQKELVQRFTPEYAPFIQPLEWLDEDPQWQKLVKQRMNGGITEYNYKISSQEALHTNSTETDEVKANFEYMMVKVNGGYDSEHDNTFSRNQDIEWSIQVRFAPKNEMSHLPKIKILTPGSREADDFLDSCKGGVSVSQKPDLNDPPLRLVVDDAAQLNDYVIAKGLLTGGHFNNSEHVIVETQGVRHDATVSCIFCGGYLKASIAESGDYLGVCLSDISIKDVQIGSIIYKASEYEKFKKNDNKASSVKLSDAEQEYLDEVSACLEDGKIGTKERRLLEKIRVNLGITEIRAKQLEQSLSQQQLSDKEKEYLEALRSCCEDAIISDKERRLLEKVRKMLDISEERAKEIERMI